MRILLVEDDEGLAEVLRKDLTRRNYLVEVANDGQAGLELTEAFDYDLILLDFMLPKLDGISLCRQLRARGDRTPVLLLTSYDSSREKVTGLDAGADDYVIKPCNFEELLARIRALLRRGNSITAPVIEWGNLQLDPSSCEVTFSGQLLALTSKEYALIELFLRNHQRIFSQSSLLDHLWSFDEPPLENTVRAHIKSLRKKLKQAGAEDLIETVYGLGYRLRAITATVPEKDIKVQPSSVSQISPDLEPIWARYRDKYRDRIVTLEKAATALAENQLDDDLWQQAIRESHTLIGSFGGFGLDEAAQLCREIEQRFNARIQDQQEPTLLSMMDQLQGLLDKSLNDPSPEPQFIQGSAELQQSRLLIVDDDPTMLAFLNALLTPWGFRLTLLEDPKQFWDALKQTAPDLLILDIEMPGLSGLELCRMVRNDPDWSELPILFLSAHTDPETIHRVFVGGGDDYVNKPILGPELVARILNRLERTHALRQLARIDGLTGVTNRREATRELERLLRLAQRQNQILCFMLLDLDSFKQVNEKYGHDAGDQVLKRLGALLKGNFRGEDVVARWGGEEFAIGLYGISRQEGAIRLQSLLENLRQETFQSAKGTQFQVTFSAGVAQYPQDGDDLQMLYQAADTVLSQAKASGRNRVLPVVNV